MTRATRVGDANPYHGWKHTPEWRIASSARQNKWTDADLLQLRVWYDARRNKPLRLAELAVILGRNRQVVSRKARALGLTDHQRKTGRKPTAKYATIEESRAAISASARARIAKNGHPRGMKGKKQRPEVLAKARAAAQRWHETTAPEVKQAIIDKTLALKKERYGNYGGSVGGSNPYSRCKYGRRDDLGGAFFRSRWEANYARFLNFLKDRGEIANWEYEADTFWFEAIRRGVRSYTPDFKVTERGCVYYVEVKGWMDPKSKTKIARMAKYHPKIDLRVFGPKAYAELAKKLGPAIPGWERDDRGRA